MSNESYCCLRCGENRGKVSQHVFIKTSSSSRTRPPSTFLFQSNERSRTTNHPNLNLCDPRTGNQPSLYTISLYTAHSKHHLKPFFCLLRCTWGHFAPGWAKCREKREGRSPPRSGSTSLLNTSSAKQKRIQARGGEGRNRTKELI